MAELHYQDDWLTIYSGDCRDAMRLVPEKSVQMCVTSPPYYGLRAYGTAKWEGGDPDCDHDKVATGPGTNIPQTKNPGVDYPIAPHRGGNPNECVRCGATRVEPTIWGGDRDHDHMWGPEQIANGPAQEQGATSQRQGRANVDEQRARARSLGSFCPCGAWRGALGLEPTFALYVEHLVEVFREVRRVLRDDGVLWLNLGDSYVADSTGDPTKGTTLQGGTRTQQEAWKRPSKMGSGLPSKNMIGIPWRVAFALQDDGWWLRSEVVWVKPNSMPSSTKDRPSSSHESIFMLTKKPHYFFDMEAVKEPVGEAMKLAALRKAVEPGRTYQHDEATRFGKTSPNRVWSDPEAMQRLLAGRHMRDVLTIPTHPYPGAHYAVFPPKLIEPLIKAATSARGSCSECGAPWRRVTATRPNPAGITGGKHREVARPEGIADRSGRDYEAEETIGETETVGWKRACEHEAEPRPCVVLDPFGGSGTTAMVAQQLGCKAILIDLNPEYIDQQMTRNAGIPLGL